MRLVGFSIVLVPGMRHGETNGKRSQLESNATQPRPGCLSERKPLCQCVGRTMPAENTESDQSDSFSGIAATDDIL